MERKYPFLSISALIILLVLASGCTQQAAPSGQNVSQVPGYIQMCLDSCSSSRNAGGFSELELGPCLLDPIPNEPDWVCDVAHSPRQEVDNNPSNQCQSFLRGEAKHFVEVTPDCKLIRAV